ncbi:MAG: sulfatase-like hydrolase/transferase [Xanthobacteraceae bacterium]
MPSVRTYLSRRLNAASAADRHLAARFALTAAIHLAALGLMVWSERTGVGKAAFLLAWGLLNCLWLALLRRPAAAAALSLTLFTVLVLLSRFKHDVLFMTVNFIDVMIIDHETFAFLMMVFPGLGWTVAAAALLALPIFGLLWWFDPLRVRFRTAALGGFTCLAVLTALSFAVSHDREEEFWDENYVSKFAMSGATAATELMVRGVFDADAAVTERLSVGAAAECRPQEKPPHIVMILDESGFDASTVPGVKVPPDYRRQFLSFDGAMRSFVVEGAGGPTWYTEYNVLSGLSARSYGRFAEFVTRVAAGRVERGLPRALHRCGYKTFSLYPWMGAFLGARSFQTAIGIDRFLDAKDLGSAEVQADRFYFDAAAGLIARERASGPLFVLVYTMANHFPWSYRFEPDRLPGWRDPGNGAEVDEYLRRQALSAEDYAQFRARLAREFPGESFLIVRFGDHQPMFAKHIIEPGLDSAALGRRIAAFDPSYFTTYYALDAVNFRPADLALAIDKLDAPYLPLVVLEAAGLPLDPSFAEQKRILERCKGLFYRCAGGAEARRFNRLLIDAGLIKG